MRFRLSQALALLVVLAWPAGLAAQELRDSVEAAAYSLSVNRITQQFGDLMERSFEYDELAYGLLEGAVSAEFAERTARRLSADLWSRYDALSDALERLPEIPEAIGNAEMRVKLKSRRLLASSTRDAARRMIASGEEILWAALSREEGAFLELEVRRIELTILQIEQHIAASELELAYTDETSVDYALSSAVKLSYQAVVVLLRNVIAEMDETIAVDWKSVGEEMLSLIAAGENHIETGRRQAESDGAALTDWTAPTPKEEQRRQILIALMRDNYPQAFDVEERILAGLAAYADSFETFTEEEVDLFWANYGVLERERSRLQLERQSSIAQAEP